MLMSNILRRSALATSTATGHPFVSQSHIGLELEIENESGRSDLRHWNRVEEGSISHGFEYVLAGPKAGVELQDALIEMQQAMEGSSATFSERTSVHIHINILDMTFLQLVSFLALLVMLEKVLYKYVEPHRTTNHFCWAFGDCEELIEIVKRLRAASERSPDHLRDSIQRELQTEACKYAGINLSAIKNYGSLELRMHHGTADTAALLRWINIIQSIKAYAMVESNTPSNILDNKISNGIPSIFENILGSYSGLLEYQGYEEDILYGIRLAQDFIYSVMYSSDSTETREPLDTRDYRVDFVNGVRSTDYLTSTGNSLRG